MLILAVALAAAASGQSVRPEPAQPTIQAGFETHNVFWPYEADSQGTVYACTYLPTVVLANRSRLVAHGNCATTPADCNGLHLASRGLGTNPNSEGKICQKHSDDGGKTWSQIRLINPSGPGMQTGQIVWDELRGALLMQYSGIVAGRPSGTVLEWKSVDLGDSWGFKRNLTEHLTGPEGEAILETGTSAGAALQLAPTNQFHPGRLVFAGYVKNEQCNGQTFWYTDDGVSYKVSKNATGGPLCVPGIGETGLGETPSGGITSSSRNQMFHGPGKCDCRATMHSADGGDSFGPLGFDPALVEPECMGTMVNGDSPSLLFHANPGHGTDRESKSPPDGRASGTVRRSSDGGKTWDASVVLNEHDAYSYSCLSKSPKPGFVGLIWETVLPGSGVPASWSTNNVVFTLIPQNFTK